MQIEWFVIRLQVWAVCGVPVAYIQKTCKLQMPRIEKQGVVNGTTSLFTAPPPFSNVWTAIPLECPVCEW